MSSVATYASVLDNEQISALFSLAEVQTAKQQIDTRQSGSVYFTLNVSEEIRAIIKNKLGLDLSSVSSIPMRWMKGDTAPHVDVGVSAFETTYLMYLTDSAGELVVDGDSYPITKGSAYVFPESLRHETIHTGAEPRLLLGPMSEQGFAVGMGGIYGPGGTSIYIRQSGINYEFSTDQTSWSTLSLPTTVTNTDTSAGVLIIEFVSDITFNNANHYFECASSHIQYGSSSLKTDGTRPIITIDGVTDYPGLIGNGSSMHNGYSNIYIYNLVVNSVNASTLASSSGWIGRDYFGKAAADNYIINCSSDGTIPNNGGGIVGRSAGSDGGASLTIIGCSSSGIIGTDGGGIAGSFGGAAADGGGGSITCESCWSTGESTLNSGGIMGSDVEFAVITNCYSTGAISAGSGGICGSNCALAGRLVTITSCYSQGAMTSGGNIGGIVGYGAGTVVITNCYSLGNMSSSDSGGILAPGGPGVKTITNCYTVGTVMAGIGYIIGGSVDIPPTCWAEANGIWNSTNASTYLLETPTSVVGITWVATVTNQPYELRNIGYTPYTIANIDTTSTPMLKRSFASSFTVGGSTSPAIISGENYTILELTGGDTGSYSSITCDSSTGALSTAPSTVVGEYTLYVRNDGSYHITEYILTLTSGGGGGGDDGDSGDAVPCCQLPIIRRGPLVDNTTYIELVAGNSFLGSVRRGNIPYYQIMAMKKARASK